MTNFEEKTMISSELEEILKSFDKMEGRNQLELLGILFEKLENGEFILENRVISPEDIGVDDAYASYASILDLVYPNDDLDEVEGEML